MAKDILLASSTYVRDMPSDLLKRRHVVVGFLDDDYKMPHNTGPKIREALRRRLFIEAKDSTIQADSHPYRKVLAYLQAPEDKKREIELALANATAPKKSLGAFALWCFITDKIHWRPDINDEVIRRGEERLFPLRNSTAPTESMLTLPPLEECLATMDTTRGTLERLHAAADHYKALAQLLEPKATALEGENSQLRLAVTQLRRERERGRTDNLEETAERYPEYPRLYSAVQSVLDDLRKREQERGHQAWDDRPLVAFWSEEEITPVRYENSFENQFKGFTASEQERIVRALAIITTSRDGQRHASLHSKRHEHPAPGVPDDAFFSRATDEIRIGWKKEKDDLVFHVVYRHGDRAYDKSEA